MALLSPFDFVYNRFSPAVCGQAFDAKSGYRTKTILAMLIRGSDKSPIGVVQVINKEEGQAFDEKVRQIDSTGVLLLPAVSMGCV